jgi:outer membrane lipoprotein SlyB
MSNDTSTMFGNTEALSHHVDATGIPSLGTRLYNAVIGKPAPAAPTAPTNLADFISANPYKSAIGTAALGGLTYAAMGGNEGISDKIQAMKDNPLATVAGLGALGVISKATYDALTAGDPAQSKLANYDSGPFVVASPKKDTIYRTDIMGNVMPYNISNQKGVDSLLDRMEKERKYNALAGSVGLGALGAIVGAAVGDKSGQSGSGAAVGGLAGAGLGALLGYGSSVFEQNVTKDMYGIRSSNDPKPSRMKTSEFGVDGLSPFSHFKRNFGSDGEIERLSKQEGNLLSKTDNAIDNFGTYLLGGGLALGAGYGGYKLYQHLKDKPLHKRAAHSKSHQSKFTAEYDHHSLLQGKQKTDLPDFLQKEIIDSRQKSAASVAEMRRYLQNNIDEDKGKSALLPFGAIGAGSGALRAYLRGGGRSKLLGAGVGLLAGGALGGGLDYIGNRYNAKTQELIRGNDVDAIKREYDSIRAVRTELGMDKNAGLAPAVSAARKAAMRANPAMRNAAMRAVNKHLQLNRIRTHGKAYDMGYRFREGVKRYAKPVAVTGVGLGAIAGMGHLADKGYFGDIDITGGLGGFRLREKNGHYNGIDKHAGLAPLSNLARARASSAIQALKSAPANLRGMPSKVIDKSRQYVANIDPNQLRNNLAFEANSVLGRARGSIRSGLDQAYRAGEGVNMPNLLRRGIDRAYVTAERYPLATALGTVGAVGTGAYMLGAEPASARIGRRVAAQYGPSTFHEIPNR